MTRPDFNFSYHDFRKALYGHLDFGYSLGLTSSHSDVLDYRAMLAREWVKKSRDDFEHQAREDRLYKDMLRS